MSALPRKAPPKIRELILDALADPKRRFLDENSPSKRWLARWDLSQKTFFGDLVDGLEGNPDRLFLKITETHNAQISYQCVLAYPEAAELSAVDVHVTLSPRGEPLRVRVAVHPSDTAQTLPPITIEQPPLDENE